MSNHLISLMVFFPAAGALIQVFSPSFNGAAARISRWSALVASLAASACGVLLILSMSQAPELQANETFSWVGSYAISYDMGVDGLSALPILLLSILFPVLIASEWNQKAGLRGMQGLFLVLQSSLFGAVFAQDLFLLLFFWAISTLPIYFLIGIWGGEGREKAAFRSMIAASIGNALIFAALVLVYYSVDPHSFSMRDLAGGKLAGKTFQIFGSTLSISGAAFCLMSIGLALRLPVWPLHGWFSSVAQEAPFSVLVAICGAVVPVGMYIFVRTSYSLFPEILGQSAGIIVVVGAINLIFGGICAVAQKGLRLLIAYLCISEVGLILVGVGSLSSAGLVGAVYQQLVLGLGMAGFGLVAGLISGRAGHTNFLDNAGERNFGGIATKAPSIAVIAGIVVASLLGFPGFAGFVGHALLMIGSYSTHPVTILIAGMALLLASYYLFTMYRFIFLGKAASSAVQDFSDLTFRERAYMFPLVAGLLVFGLYPKPLIELIRPTVLTLLSTVK